MAKIININIEQFKQMYADDCVVICDVREADEYNREHIDGAINHPLSQFDTANLVDVVKNSKLVIHCQSGNRTKLNAAKFAKLNLEEVYILDGGLNAWKSQGCATVKNNTAPLPIMRQVQIATGLLILCSVILGYYHNSTWYWLSGFVGAGLMFAGITGYCGMANLLMLLPYNRQNNCSNRCTVK